MTNEELPTAERVETSVPIRATVVSATPINPSSPPEKYLLIWSLSRTVKVFSFIDLYFAFIIIYIIYDNGTNYCNFIITNNFIVY